MLAHSKTHSAMNSTLSGPQSRKLASLLLGAALGASPVFADDLTGSTARSASASSSFAKPSTEEILKLIDVSPYHVPLLPLMTNQNYAHSSADVEPFGAVKPFKEHFLVQMEYTGPGRAIPEPEEVDAVRIGFLGPIMPTVSVATGGASHEEVLGIAMLRGCRLAVEQANARGGYLKRKIPFELVVRNDNGLWGASGNEIITMAYQDHVWAILGTIDGANTHIAIRVALKAELPMLSSGDLDPTYIETNIPWVFRNIGDDRQQNYLLLDYLYRKMNYQRVAVIRASNRYGRFGVREIRDGSRRIGRPLVIEMAYRVGDTDFTMQLERIKESRPDAVIHWGNAVEGARVLNQMRALNMNQPFLACDRCVSDEFVSLAGPNAEGVLCTYPWDPTRQDPKLDTFKREYRERWGVDPDTYAAHAYDGMNMLMWAIQTAGLNRAKIRDVLAHLPEPFPGVTGDIPLSAALDDAGEVYLTRHEQGQWKFYSRDSLGIPRGQVIQTMRVERDQASAR
jgi:ABC-type branched-subunit amino acid transport system substrate-binding protein